MTDKLTGLSLDIEAAEREKLQAVFPQCFEEGKLNIDRLLNLCGEYITDDFEKYEFRWKGKSECVQIAGKRSAGTLRPCPEESVDWENTKNLYIEGDNLEVLKLLQTSYYRKVKMIYIDPPYNTGNDFVYADDFADPLARYREITQQTTKSNPETMGRFHTNWLNMMWPRLRLAANLLRDDGVCFISCDDNEQVNLRKICDEVFGEENFYTQVIVQSNKRGQTYKQISKTHEYLLIYTKQTETEFNELEKKADNNDLNLSDNIGSFNIRELRNRNPKFGKFNRPNLFYPIYVNPTQKDKNGLMPVSLERSDEFCVEVLPLNSTGGESCWRWGQGKVLVNNKPETMNSNLVAKAKNDGGYNIYEKYRKSTYKPKTIWDDVSMITEKGTVELGELGLAPYFDFPKPLELIKRAIQIGTNDNDIILDFFSGSATTAHAVMQLNAEDGGNRRFICVQLPEVTDEKSEAYKAGYKNICEIGKERIRRAGAKIKDTKQEISITHHISPVAVPNADTLDNEADFHFVKTMHENYKGGLKLDIKKLSPDSVDTGFRVFKLDSSNLKIWDDSPLGGEEAASLFEQRLWDYLDVLVPGRTPVEVTYEIMLKLGQDLCSPIVPIELPVSSEQGVVSSNNRIVYGVCPYTPTNNSSLLTPHSSLFIVCLAPGITPEDAAAMADYAPGRIVFAEQCFETTEQKSNVRLTLKDLGISIKTL